MNQKAITVVGIIPARAGSTGVRKKNIENVGGLPLIAHTIKAGLEASLLDAIYVSTEDDEIATIASHYRAEVIPHPAELSGDTTPSFRVVQYDVQHLSGTREFTHLALLRATSPLRTASDIDACIRLIEQTQADSVVSVTELEGSHPYKMYFLEEGKLTEVTSGEGEFPMRRQELPSVYVRNEAIYVVKKEVVSGGSLWGTHIVPYFMPEERSVNINKPGVLHN